MTSLTYWQAFCKEHKRLGTQIVSIPLGDLERLVEDLRRLKGAIVIHRGERTNWVGGVHDADRRLWERIADIPQSDIRGDG